MNGKNIALVAAAAIIAYLIYLYDKKKTAVASQITGYEATATQPGTSIPVISTPNSIDAILATNPVFDQPGISVNISPGPIPELPAGSGPLPNYYSDVPNPYPAPLQIPGMYGSMVPGYSAAS